jgi:hypothetical protein
LIVRVRIRVFLAAIVLLAASSAGATQEPAGEDLAAFLRDTGDLAQRIGDVEPAGARDLAARLPAAWQVRHGDQAFTITTEWITGPLRQAAARPEAWPTTREGLLAGFAAMRAEAADLDALDRDPAASSASSVTAARAALREVLSRSEFRRRDEHRWTDDVRRQIKRWFDELLDRFSIGRRATAALSKWLAWIVGLAALATLVVYLYRARLPRRSWTPLAIDLPRATSAEWAARAYAALRAGDAREAMHCGYHAVLFRLEEQGVWRVDDARTPREYVSLLPAQDARRAAFLDLTRRFEQTWYGSRAADGETLLTHLEAFGCHAPSKPSTSPS